jgi:type II secretory pathway pseudopilin PulG
MILRHGQIGFSIIEFMVIVAIFGILAAISLPRILTANKQVAYTTARQIIADMRYARRLAIAKAHVCTVSFSGNRYIISCKGVTISKTLQEGVSWTGDDKFIFSPIGEASSGNMVTIISGDNQYDINVVAATGRVYHDL